MARLPAIQRPPRRTPTAADRQHLKHLDAAVRRAAVAIVATGEAGHAMAIRLQSSRNPLDQAIAAEALRLFAAPPLPTV